MSNALLSPSAKTVRFVVVTVREFLPGGTFTAGSTFTDKSYPYDSRELAEQIRASYEGLTVLKAFGGSPYRIISASVEEIAA